MTEFSPALLSEIRARFAHVDACPFSGERIFFENAGGALTLQSVVATSAKFAAIPDNQGRANAGSKALVDIIAKARQDACDLFHASSGHFFVGESGTELLFRLIRNAATASAAGGDIVGSTVEHPASRSAAHHWAEQTGRPYRAIAHDAAGGYVTADSYAKLITPHTRVATILHTSPVSGMGMDVGAIAAQIRAISPECYIIVDGIQHAAHGDIQIDQYDIDGYVISPYKMFSRHGFGFAWISDRLRAAPHERLLNGPEDAWEFGTRDTGAYATMSDVVAYFDWLGGQIGTAETRAARINDAAQAIHAHEHALTHAMLNGIDNLVGLAEMTNIDVLGAPDDPRREGLVGFRVKGVPSANVVDYLNDEGIRTHTRKADHYSGNILDPLGWDDCIRVSLCHYNTLDEVRRLLGTMARFSD